MILLSTTSTVLITIGLVLFSYLLGSMPFGVWVGKSITGIDVREHGSKNIGTTNCIRVLGKKVGFLIFFLDVLKGALVIILVQYIFEPLNIFDSPIPNILYGVAAVMGHAFSIFLHFKGGKSVAASLGIVFALTPISALSCLVVFGLVLIITGYVCLCSSFAAVTVVSVTWILYLFGSDDLFFIMKPHLLTCILYSIIALFLIYKHKNNFIRLAHGTENCFKKKKKQPEVTEESTSTEENKKVNE